MGVAASRQSAATEQEHRPCPLENPRAGWALIFRPCLCVMAKRQRDVCTCRKANALACRTRLRRPPLICRRRGDESQNNSEFRIRSSGFEMSLFTSAPTLSGSCISRFDLHFLSHCRNRVNFLETTGKKLKY
jgi:hypothetical protein